MSEVHNFLEIETKYDADNVDRIEFKKLASSLSPKSFLYVESEDHYYVKGESEFLRHRNPPSFGKDKRAELTFKKKHSANSNVIRTEVNLRVDMNDQETVKAFCEGLGYRHNFSIFKLCDIYYLQDGTNIVYYTVIDDDKKSRNYIEIEVKEGSDITEDQAWEIISKYEKALAPLGISAQKRKRLSLFEMYVKKDQVQTPKA
jgi:adenylate cyclase class IV